MSAKKSRLGRGLGALLGDSQSAVVSKPAPEKNPANAKVNVPVVTTPESDKKGGTLTELPIEFLKRGSYQPRTHIDQDALQELADSISTQGIVQPILVRALGAASNSYEIVAGERRWRAAQLAGLDKVPVIIRKLPDESAIAVALIENIQREDLNPVEEANGIRRLIDEFGMTHQKAADAVGRSRTAVSNLLRLLGLGARVKEKLETRLLDMGHARALLSLPIEKQNKAAEAVIARGLSVRAAEQLVKQLLLEPSSSSPKNKNVVVDPDVQRLQDDLSNKIGAVVRIDHAKGGRGKLTIAYSSLEELDGILGRIR